MTNHTSATARPPGSRGGFRTRGSTGMPLTTTDMTRMRNENEAPKVSKRPKKPTKREELLALQAIQDKEDQAEFEIKMEQLQVRLDCASPSVGDRAGALTDWLHRCPTPFTRSTSCPRLSETRTHATSMWSPPSTRSGKSGGTFTRTR